MGKYKKKPWYLIFGLLCLKNCKNLGIMIFKGRSKMSLSRISAESSQIFWRAPNAPWRQKEDMRHIEAQTTEIVSDQPGELKSSCRQRSAETVLNFILSFFWWSRNLAMRNVRWCLMWPQLINPQPIMCFVRLIRTHLNAPPWAWHLQTDAIPQNAPWLMCTFPIDCRLQCRSQTCSLRSRYGTSQILMPSEVCFHGNHSHASIPLRWDTLNTCGGKKKIRWRRHDALIWSARLRLRQGQKQKETRFCC